MTGRATAMQAVSRSWAAWQDPRFRYRLGLLAFFAAAVAAFGHVTEDYLTGDPIVRWDVRFAAWLHEHSSDWLVTAFKVVTLAGNAVVLALLVLAVGFVLWRRRAVHDAVLLVVVAGGIEILNAGLKLAFHRPRPELAFVHLDTYSFPSGHAAGATAIYGALVFLAARGATRRRRIELGVGVVLLVAAIDFSRLYLGVHYLSDVLAGSALGGSWLALCLLAHELRPRWFRLPRQLTRA